MGKKDVVVKKVKKVESSDDSDSDSSVEVKKTCSLN